jgi:hypothetical protein
VRRDKALVPSSVLYGTEEERPKDNRPQVAQSVPTFKDLVAPQTRHLFTSIIS